MRRQLALLMVMLSCIGITDALRHVHVWVTAADGGLHVVHAVSGQADTNSLGHEHAHHLLASLWSDPSTVPAVHAVPPPAQHIIPDFPIPAALAARHDRQNEYQFHGGDPPRPPPNLVQHRSVILLI